MGLCMGAVSSGSLMIAHTSGSLTWGLVGQNIDYNARLLIPASECAYETDQVELSVTWSNTTNDVFFLVPWPRFEFLSYLYMSK